MIKLIVFSVLLNPSESNIYATLPSEPPKIEARKRGKRHKGDRRRGGGGLR